jgi:1,4-alpha-glucan branching enzyme
MRETIGQTPNSITQIYRPDHDESGKYTFHTKILNDHILERNKRIRLESLMTKGKSIPLLEAGVEYAFSIASEEWGFFKRDYPDIVAGIRSKDEEERFKAARQLQILHPEWVIMAGDR